MSENLWEILWIWDWNWIHFVRWIQVWFAASIYGLIDYCTRSVLQAKVHRWRGLGEPLTRPTINKFWLLRLLFDAWMKFEGDISGYFSTKMQLAIFLAAKWHINLISSTIIRKTFKVYENIATSSITIQIWIFNPLK